MQHTYAKTFNNVELLHNFEENVNNKSIDSIIKNQESLQKEDKYIEKLRDKISSKISSPNIVKNNNIIQHDDKKKYIFLKFKNPSIILRKENIVKDGKYKIHLTKNMFNKLLEEKQLKYVFTNKRKEYYIREGGSLASIFKSSSSHLNKN